MGSIRPGDALQVFPKAIFPGWENHVKGVQIEVFYEDGQSSQSGESITAAPPQSSAQLSSITTLKATPSLPRIVCYYQTQHNKETPVSLRPLVDEQTGVTHLVVAAFHLNTDPTDITLNSDPLGSARLDSLWEEMAHLQNSGVKVLAMLGGAAPGTFARLDGSGDTFISFYRPLMAFLKERHFDGIDLDVEEEMSLDGIIRLIDQLRLDFGQDFLITLAPVATALQDSHHLSGFDYELLELRRGHYIDWYNAQFYCGWCGPSQALAYGAIVNRGWPSHRFVLGLSTNPDTAGYVSMDQFESTLTQIASEKSASAGFGGIMGWEYFNALPGGTESPWQWFKQVSGLVRKYFGGQGALQKDQSSEQVVSVELKGSEVAKIVKTSQDEVVTVEMKVTDNAGISGAEKQSDSVVSMEMRVTDMQ